MTGPPSVDRMSRTPALVRLLRHRDPGLLALGQAVSNFGDGVANVALTLLVLDTWHGASGLGWFAAARMAPQVAFLLVGGAIVDRHSRRLLLILSDSVRMVATGGLVILLVLHQLNFAEMILYAIVFGAFDALFFPASNAMTPEIVPEDLLTAMNSWRPFSSNVIGQMIGPAVGGLLATWSTSWAIGIDAATFAVSALCLAAMAPTPTPERREGSSMVAEIKEGLSYVRQTFWLKWTLLAVTLSNAFVFVPTGVLLPYLLRHTLHASKSLVGVALASFGLAGAIGALVASNVPMPRRRLRTMWTVWTAGSFSAFAMAMATHFWMVLIFPVVSAPLLVWGNVMWESMLQTEVPRELLGRVSSVDWFVSLGMSPVGLIVAGQLAGAIGVRTYYWLVPSLAILPGLAMLLSRRVNEVDRARVEAPSSN